MVSSELLTLSLPQILSFFLLFWPLIDKRSQKCTFYKKKNLFSIAAKAF